MAYYAVAPTVVFWDVDDFPIPTGRSYLETVTSVLRKNGYHGVVSIYAYGSKKPDDLDDGITFVLKRQKYWRLHRMLLDISLWALDRSIPTSSRENMMFIAVNIKEVTTLAPVFQGLYGSFNILLVLPDDYNEMNVKLPYTNFIWSWESLINGGKPMDQSLVFELRKKFHTYEDDA